MKKQIKILSLPIVFILIFSLLPSCGKNKSEKEYAYSGTLEDGGRWFYAEINYASMASPIEGTYEKTLAQNIYLNTVLTNGKEVFPFARGTIVKIEYDGELLLHSGMGIPVVSNVYSVEKIPYATEFGGVHYEIEVTQYDFKSDEVKSEAINIDPDNSKRRAPHLLKSESADDLAEIYEKTIGEGYNKIEAYEYDYYFSRYSDDFFEDNILLMLFFGSNSSGDRYVVDGIDILSGKLTVNVKQTQIAQTCDGSSWLFCISVPRETAESITEFDACYIN